MNNLIGISIGRYHILEQLGEGGMATVYKAHDTRLEREVAIKVIRRNAFPEDQIDRILKRFEREAKALARLSHPNIIKVIDYGEYENSPYLVMEYLPGGTLKQRMGKSVPFQEAVQTLIPIAEALEYAHEQNIIHRDVKPSNILLMRKGQPMLTDFGIAKILEVEETATLTGTGIGVGTPEYMAPEQWTGQPTKQSDIYSLGVILYEMLTGRKPYTADTPAAILLKQATEPLLRPGKLVSGLPQAVENVLLKALARNPKDRYADMEEFGNALNRLLNDKGMSKKSIDAKSNEGSTHGPRKDLQFPSFSLRAIIIGLVVLGVGLTAIFSSSLKSLLMEQFTRMSNSTPEIAQNPNEIVDGQGVPMMLIPSGEFAMGRDEGSVDEQPLHTVFLDDYYIDKYEVSNGQYRVCVNAKVCIAPDNTSSYTRLSYYGNSLSDNYPVIFVSWEAANTYCEWRGAQLPTEAQWEKAARGTDDKIYPWGDELPNSDLLNFNNKIGDTTEVGKYPSGQSEYGVHDLAGNVWEWVNDWYVIDYYKSSPSANPLGSADGNEKVLRGGSWNLTDYFARVSDRDRYHPSNVSRSIGFRCAKSQ